MPEVLLHVESSIAPDDYLRAAAGMLAAIDGPDAAPRLGIFGLSGQALLLGRHQRLASAVHVERARADGFALHRRLTGGRTVAVGQGTVAFTLALPHPSALVPSPIPLSKVMNRYVRGVLSMAALLKAPTYYFARDHISCGGRQTGNLSFEALPSGATLVECLIGVGRRTEPPKELVAYPPREAGDDPPPSVSYSEVLRRESGFEEVRDALLEGCRRTYSIETSDAGAAPRATEPRLEEDEQGLESSGIADIAIGYLEALVRMEDERIAEARLRGDLIAPTEAIRRLEGAAVGQPLDFVAIGRRVDEVCKDPFATLMGLRHLRIIPDAFIEAGRAAAEADRS